MKKLFGFLCLLAIAGGVIWYENRPVTVKIPVETADPVPFDTSDYTSETTTTATPTTIVHHATVDFSSPDATMQVNGSNGDDVTVKEVVSRPHHLGNLPDDVESTLMSCPGVTDRDMAVQVDAQVELDSSLQAKVDVNYGVLGQPAVFDLSDGLQCSEGNITYDMQPNGTAHTSYWVVLSGAVTPDHPNGDFSNGAAINGLNVTLPSLETYTWKEWGPNVYNCGDILGVAAKVLIAGPPLSDCQLAATEASSLGSA